MRTSSRSRSGPGIARQIALTAAIASLAACGGHSSQAVAPSAITSNPSNYDGQSITVTGKVTNARTREMRFGTASLYQLCDTACINVVQFGSASVTDGSQSTVSGHFRASFGRQRVMTNVLVVGGRGGP
ncbi:MAG: hypothetical protein WCB99_14660 [Candidatus Cybelea sp.]|jgi:hypothetical protein